jgi:hypothetical protein
MVGGVAADDGVGMAIDPTPKTATVSQNFTVDIKVTNSGGAEVNAAGAHLNFSTTYLEVVSIAPGTALGTVMTNTHSNAAGTIDYEATVGTPTNPPVTTDFVLARVTFRAKAVTAGTPLTFVFTPALRQTAVYAGIGNVLNAENVDDGTVSITAPMPTVAFSASTYSVNEGSGSRLITVQLSATSTATVTVNYATTTGGTASAGLDYTTAGATLTFSPGQISKTFSVSIADDTTVEPSETVNLALTSPVNATPGSPNTAVLTIVDNDAAPVGGTAYWPNKLLMLLPWIAIGAAVIAGISLLVRRRHGAVR